MIWAKDLNSRGEVISARLKGPQEMGIITFILTLAIVPSVDPQNFILWIDCHFYFLVSVGLLYCANAIFSVYLIWTSFAPFEMLGQSCRIIVYQNWFLFSFSKPCGLEIGRRFWKVNLRLSLSIRESSLKNFFLKNCYLLNNVFQTTWAQCINGYSGNCSQLI